MGKSVASDPDFLLRIECDEELLRTIEENNWIARTVNTVASQGGEDGVIRTLIDRLGLDEPGWCVELGACDGWRDSNTWHLINECGWSGVLIEPDPQWYEQLTSRYRHRADVHCLNRAASWTGVDGLDTILATTPIPKAFSLLVIDVDGLDYHIWRALDQYQPEIVCIEFHRLVHPSVVWVPPMDASLHRPASLKSLCELGKEKGYECAGVVNWNAFFVRQTRFPALGIADNRPERMFHAHEEMRVFQGYDGTLRLCGNDRHYWKYQLDTEGRVTSVPISQRDLQVLPDGLRVFRPRHTYECRTLAEAANRLDAERFRANRLLRHRRNVTSECGEDGILDELFSMLRIRRGYAVDVGACDGLWCSQTWTLFARQGWQGLAIERDPDVFPELANRYRRFEGVTCLHETVGCDPPHSLDAILTRSGTPESFEFLSIDVEGDDYHLWRSLTQFAPLVVAIDFNPSIGNDIAFVQACQAPSPFGASLRALVWLGRENGYELTAVTDWNAIFVRRDRFAELDITPNRIDHMYAPPFEMRMTQTPDGELLLLTGATLVRQDLPIAHDDFQVLPRGLRGRDTSSAAFGQLRSCFYHQRSRSAAGETPV